MKKYAYYHSYLTDDVAAWSSILLNNYKKMEDSGLLDELDKIYLVVVGSPTNVKMAYGLSKHLSDKYEFIAYKNPMENDKKLVELNNDKLSPPHVSENVTIKHLYDHACREDAYFLYNHSKGVTTFERFLKQGYYNWFINHYYWKEFITWGVIDEWKNCVEALEIYDVVGANYQTTPEPHFSGNFWWSKSSHIKKLPDPSTEQWWFDLQKDHSNKWLRNASVRFKDEMWVCSEKNTMTLNVKDISSVASASLIKARAIKNLYA